MADSNRKRLSLLLVNPKCRHRYHGDLKGMCKVMGRRTAVHPLALPTLAAMTPEHYDIAICDEEIAPIRFETRPDIVGITALGANINRAYAVADRFRGMGVPVVMGGPQVSFNIDETLDHADAVVIGEAEGVWQQCLADFESGRLNPTYKRDAPWEYITPPRPRWDLVDTDKIMALPVQASRGCPYKCEFCVVRNLFGHRHRYRDMDNLIDEIQSLPKRQLTFVDDNLTANKPYARELMQRLKPLRTSWFCQASVDVGEDDDLLHQMAEAGCTSILMGIESLNPESLEETGKFQNKIEKYEEVVRRIHSHGIHVMGAFVVGFDADRVDAFDHIYDFTLRTGISLVVMNVLTAYPGTNLYDRLKRAGRICPADPEMLGIYPTMRYRNISQTEIFTRYFDTLERMFSFEVVRQKARKVFATAAFHEYNGGDVTAGDKFRTLVYLARHFLLTTDKHRRGLLTDLWSLKRKKKVDLGKVVEYLLLIASYNGYLKFTRDQRAEVLESIRKSDPGPLVPQA